MVNEETEQIEDKQSLAEWKEIVEATAAFATSSGGVIRIGIAPDGHHKGIEIGKKTLEDLANRIAGHTHPPQYPSITFDGPEESAVIQVAVEESPVKPVWAFNVPMKRVGRTSQRIAPHEVERLMQITTGRTWDALPCEDMTLDDIDPDAMHAFLRRSELSPDTPMSAVFENLKLVRSGILLNGASLLFAKNPQRFVVQAVVQCGRFVGTSLVDFLDEKTLYGNVIEQIEGAMAFVKRNTRQAIVITGKPERDVVPEYPEEAVREAVTNAVCHRDYASTSTVQVRINDQCLEVWNPGALPADFSVEELYVPHRSRPHNPNLAGALYRARLIEHWGTGTLRIVRACEAARAAKPEFSYRSGLFIVRFPGPSLNELPDRQRQALAFVGTHGSITREQFEKLSGLARTQAKRELRALVEAGLLRIEGSGPAARYVTPSA